MEKEIIPIGISRYSLLKDAYISDKAIPRKSYFTKDVTMTIRWFFGGYQILFEKGNKTLSAIFHSGSYGSEEGLWEIMPQILLKNGEIR